MKTKREYAALSDELEANGVSIELIFMTTIESLLFDIRELLLRIDERLAREQPLIPVGHKED